MTLAFFSSTAWGGSQAAFMTWTIEELEIPKGTISLQIWRFEPGFSSVLTFTYLCDSISCQNFIPIRRVSKNWRLSRLPNSGTNCSLQSTFGKDRNIGLIIILWNNKNIFLGFWANSGRRNYSDKIYEIGIAPSSKILCKRPGIHKSLCERLKASGFKKHLSFALISQHMVQNPVILQMHHCLQLPICCQPDNLSCRVL